MIMGKKRQLEDLDDTRKKNEQKAKLDNYGRKVWDKEFYKKKVEKKELEEEDEDELLLRLLSDTKKPKVMPPATERKLLEQRKEELALEKNLGKTQILTLKTPKAEQGGYYCEICDCVVKDSQTYLDHINGKNHNRMLGYSMKVKKVAVDDVKKKLERLKNKKYNKEEVTKKDPYEEAKNYAKEIEDIEEQRSKRRKEKKLQKKLEKQKQKDINSDIGEEENNINLEIEKMGLPTSFI